MSGVPVGKRSLSSMEFYISALRLRSDVTKLVTSAAIPKSYRFIVSVPMAETARSLVANILKAESFYPTTHDAVTERKRYYTLAIADCRLLEQDLQCARECCDAVKVSRFDTIIEDIQCEIALIKGVRAKTKLIERKGR